MLFMGSRVLHRKRLYQRSKMPAEVKALLVLVLLVFVVLLALFFKSDGLFRLTQAGGGAVNSTLVVFDTTDSQVRTPYQTIALYANYSKTSDGAPIPPESGGSCAYSRNDSGVWRFRCLDSACCNGVQRFVKFLRVLYELRFKRLVLL